MWVGQILRDLFTLHWNFSNAKNAFSDLRAEFDRTKESFGKIGNNIGNMWNNGATAHVFDSLSQIGNKAKSTQADLNGIKTPTIAENNAKVLNLGAASNKKVKVGYTFDTSSAKLSSMNKQFAGQSVKTKVTADTSKIGNFMQHFSRRLIVSL